MAIDTIVSTSDFKVTENPTTGKRAVEFYVSLDDGSPFSVIVPEAQVNTLFESTKKYLATK